MSDISDRFSSHSASSKGQGEAMVLILAACPLLFWLFLGSTRAAIAAVVYVGLLALAARLIARGRRQEAKYKAASVARRPRVPRKLIGEALIGVIALLLAAHQFSTWTPPALIGTIAFLLSLAAFGLDPWRDKGFDNPDYLAERAAQATLEMADARMTALVGRVAALGEHDLALRTEAIRSAILRMIRVHALRPQEFFALKKPLEKFIDLAEGEVDALETGWKTDAPGAAHRYMTRIAALSDGFETRARKWRAERQSDAYALDADLLLDRMEQNRAA
ncbi:hypothetical protein SAMN05421853_10167 [Roseivivax halotolerans]|uniref:5-bromo-4-chloroindolyl phosphate hydrolysis protein n=1 Tax=Roseivivax halotolerans TaxID=93684 RepID=A0A1I5UND6_9RHOB|nr:hypothetical protein [Roseivivax halotolerans]SFP96567.1 hypothetical protein SAMN05421853_10167 [Roseivivax halotolerans]